MNLEESIREFAAGELEKLFSAPEWQERIEAEIELEERLKTFLAPEGWKLYLRLEALHNDIAEKRELAAFLAGMRAALRLLASEPGRGLAEALAG